MIAQVHRVVRASTNGSAGPGRACRDPGGTGTSTVDADLAEVERLLDEVHGQLAAADQETSEAN